MDNSNGSRCGSSLTDQNSLGILNMDNLRVFGDLSSLSNSSNGDGAKINKEKSDVFERLKAGRLKALETLDKPRPRSSYVAGSLKRTSVSSSRKAGENDTNISDLITEDTINLNSSGSMLMTTPAPLNPPNILFEPGEITGRSTLCRNEQRPSVAKQSSRVSVADILRSSFVEKARVQFTKRLENTPSNENTNTSSTISDSFSYSRSLPHTADMSNMSVNGGGGISFGSAAGQGVDESFAPAEMMQSKLVMGEISWAQEFAVVPTATLSKQALEKIAAQPKTPEIETSISGTSFNGNDPNFSLGNYFKMRSERFSMIEEEKENRPIDTQTTLASIGEITPHVDNKTYTKAESTAKMERNMMKKMQQEKYNKALQMETRKKSPTNSEILSLSAIDEALRNLDLNSDTSIGDVMHKFRAHGNSDENKENEFTDDTLCKSKSKFTDTMSFTDSILDCTDFKQLQESIASTSKRQALSPLADFTKPNILVTPSEENDADVDEWPTTPVKSPGRRVRHTKSISSSQRSVSPTSSDGVHKLPTTDEDEDPNEDDDKTPVNRKHQSVVKSVAANQKSFSSTRLDGCDAVPSSTECDFGISPNLAKSVQNLSPLSSPRSCLSSSPLLDSTTNSDRRMLLSGSVVALRANSSPAGSEASSTSGFISGARRGVSGAPRSISRCSNSSEFSHRDGKLLPLKVTHTSLCWGSSKLRTDVRKSMQIKNTSDKRLVVRLCIQGPGFQLVNLDCNLITLQAMECRTICINFCPTVSGAAIGILSFNPPFPEPNRQQPGLEIPLYGYGGNASVTIQGLLKGPVGSSFLTIGNVCDLASGPLTATFRFYNKGPLTAFAGITVDSTMLLKPRLSAAFDLRPNKVIIAPYKEAVVQVVFQPNREDIKKILKKSSQVLTLANMRIFCGDEPNRQRMRALAQRMTSEQREQLTSTMLDNIWSTFPGEQTIPGITMLHEPPEFVLDLVTMVRIIDVALTLNRDFDESAETSHIFLPDADETVLFRTVCAANSPTPSNLLEPVDELHEADTTSSIDQSPQERSWSVHPKAITFDFTNSSNSIDKRKLTITNNYGSSQYIEINCDVPNLLQISPMEASINPDGGHVEVSIRAVRIPYRELLNKNVKFCICVSMESERINVPVTFNV